MHALAHSLLVAAALAAPLGSAAAEPAITITVPAAPGADWDRAARALGAALVSIGAASDVAYENRAGAGGTTGFAQFLAAPRGKDKAILVAGQELVAATEMDRRAARVFEATPIARLAASHYAVFVPAGSPFRTMADLARAFKADPAAIAWDAGARGSPGHLLVAYLARTLGADAARVRTVASSPGAAVASAGVARLHDLRDLLRSGRVRALAVTAPAAEAGIASLREQGINVVFGDWCGLFAAPGLRPSQRDDLLDRVKAATQSPQWQALLRELGWAPAFMQGSDYARFIDEESRSLGYLADSMGLRRR